MASLLDEKQIKQAVDALVSGFKAQKDKNLVSEEGDSYFVGLALKKVPKSTDDIKTKGIQVPLPAPIYPENMSICVIVPDPVAKADDKITEENLKIEKVLPLSQLKKEHGSFEDKRKLFSSYDLFLVDASITDAFSLRGVKRNRYPIPVHFDRELKKQIDKIRHSTSLFISGTCCTVRIANTNMSKEEVLQNVMTGIPAIIEKIPEGWDNVQSIYLRTSHSLTLPLFSRVSEGQTKKKQNKNKDKSKNKNQEKPATDQKKEEEQEQQQKDNNNNTPKRKRSPLTQQTPQKQTETKTKEEEPQDKTTKSAKKTKQTNGEATPVKATTSAMEEEEPKTEKAATPKATPAKTEEKKDQSAKKPQSAKKVAGTTASAPTTPARGSRK